jgi:hypothetical protein
MKFVVQLSGTNMSPSGSLLAALTLMLGVRTHGHRWWQELQIIAFFVPGIGMLGMKWCSSVEHDFYGPLRSQQAIPICMFVCLINIFGGVFKWT